MSDRPEGALVDYLAGRLDKQDDQMKVLIRDVYALGQSYTNLIGLIESNTSRIGILEAVSRVAKDEALAKAAMVKVGKTAANVLWFVGAVVLLSFLDVIQKATALWDWIHK